MKSPHFFFSGVAAMHRGDPIYEYSVRNCRCRLQSCHGSYVKSMHQWLEKAVEIGVSKGVRLMLDSGAFTAWSLGHETTLSQLMPVYQDVWQRYGKHFEDVVMINLDVIPGTREREATPEELQQALIDSDVNFRALVKEFGPRILPVFHQGEPWERYAECYGMADYVCISPRQNLSEVARVRWLHQVAGLTPAGLRLHGLATTSARSVRACPWFSVDSATWVMAGGMGAILFPARGWIQPLSVSEESPDRHIAGRHYCNISDAERAAVDRVVHYYGFDMDWLVRDHSYRQAFNLIVTQEATKQIQPVRHIQQGLF